MYVLAPGQNIFALNSSLQLYSTVNESVGSFHEQTRVTGI